MSGVYSMKKRILAMLILLLSVLAFAGCGSENATDNADAGKAGSTGEVVVTEDSATSSDTTVTDTDNADTELLVLTAINLTGIDIGMFSVIDPATGEQANIGGLKSNEKYTFECNWPKDTKEFKYRFDDTEFDFNIKVIPFVKAEK